MNPDKNELSYRLNRSSIIDECSGYIPDQQEQRMSADSGINSSYDFGSQLSYAQSNDKANNSNMQGNYVHQNVPNMAHYTSNPVQQRLQYDLQQYHSTGTAG